jgi:hypothetical protein
MAARDVSSGRRRADAGRVMWGVTSVGCRNLTNQPRAENGDRSLLRGAEDTSLALLFSHARFPTDPAATLILPASIQSLDGGLGRVFGGLLSARRALLRPHSRRAEVGLICDMD